MNKPLIDRKTRRTVAAPPPSNPRVEWQWTETIEGRFVTGYRLVPRSAVARST